MSYLVLLVGLGLGALWVIALATNAAAGWFLWLVFCAAVILLFASFGNIEYLRRRPRTPA